MLKITELLDRKPSELSGGQRQRVAIGRALVREVGVYLFDEPLSNLDAQLRAELRVEIKRLHQRLKATMIYVTHDQIEALTLADRIAVMKDRVIQQLGTPQRDLSSGRRTGSSLPSSARRAMNFVARPAAARRRHRRRSRPDGFTLPLPRLCHSSAAPRGRRGRARHPARACRGRGERPTRCRSRWSSRWAATCWPGAGSAARRSRCACRRRSPPRAGDRVAVAIPPAKVSLFDRASGRRL